MKLYARPKVMTAVRYAGGRSARTLGAVMAATAVLATGLIAAATSQASTAATWSGNFQTGNLSQWNSYVHQARPDGVTVQPGTWMVISQWHQDYESCPPNMGLYITGDAVPRLKLGIRSGSLATSTCTPGFRTSHDLGPLPTGRWNDFVFRVKWSANPSVGSVMVKLNGKTVLEPKVHATLHNGQGAYFKQGIYRGSQSRTHVLHFTGTRKGPTEASVALPE